MVPYSGSSEQSLKLWISNIAVQILVDNNLGDIRYEAYAMPCGSRTTGNKLLKCENAA
jgi:hypothetical protein